MQNKLNTESLIDNVFDLILLTFDLLQQFITLYNLFITKYLTVIERISFTKAVINKIGAGAKGVFQLAGTEFPVFIHAYSLGK